MKDFLFVTEKKHRRTLFKQRSWNRIYLIFRIRRLKHQCGDFLNGEMWINVQLEGVTESGKWGELQVQAGWWFKSAIREVRYLLERKYTKTKLNISYRQNCSIKWVSIGFTYHPWVRSVTFFCSLYCCYMFLVCINFAHRNAYLYSFILAAIQWRSKYTVLYLKL